MKLVVVFPSIFCHILNTQNVSNELRLEPNTPRAAETPDPAFVRKPGALVLDDIRPRGLGWVLGVDS